VVVPKLMHCIEVVVAVGGLERDDAFRVLVGRPILLPVDSRRGPHRHRGLHRDLGVRVSASKSFKMAFQVSSSVMEIFETVVRPGATAGCRDPSYLHKDHHCIDLDLQPFFKSRR